MVVRHVCVCGWVWNATEKKDIPFVSTRKTVDALQNIVAQTKVEDCSRAGVRVEDCLRAGVRDSERDKSRLQRGWYLSIRCLDRCNNLDALRHDNLFIILPLPQEHSVPGRRSFDGCCD